MKKSNKVSVFYALSSFLLFSILIFGGCYGIYLSVGLNFVRSSVSNLTDGVGTGAQNVSFGGSVNFPTSMIGVIILSIVLIVLSVFDFISLIKQIVLFKQFKIIRESKLESKIEKKVKSKGLVIFFAILIDIVSLGVGITGIFVNARSFAGGNFVWLMYAIDSAVAIFSLLSLVLLIVKLRQVSSSNKQEFIKCDDCSHECGEKKERFVTFGTHDDINELETTLLKLRHLKSSRLISADEFEMIRKGFLNSSEKVNNECNENDQCFDEEN